MNKFLAVICTVLVLSASGQAQLDEIDFSGSNQLRYDNGREVDTRRVDPNNPYPGNTIRRHFVENKLVLNLFSGNFHLGGRYLYFKPSEADIYQFRLEDENRFDKRFFAGTIDPFSFRLGHFSDLWGSGLAFSSFENRDLFFDSELDGARVQLNAGSIKLIGLTGKTADGPLVSEMKATAGRVEMSPGQGRRVGFSYVYHDSLSNPEMGIAGVDWNLTRGIFNLYGERAWNEAVLAGGNSKGHATFVGATLSKLGWSLLAEYADYRYNIVTPIQNPPTTHREIGPRLLQGREPHVLNIPDEVGFQVELSGTVLENTYITAHYNSSSRHSGADDFVSLPKLEEKYRPFWEGFVNLEHDFTGGQHLFFEAGANEEANVVWQDRLWLHARLKFPFRGSQEIEFETEQLLITDRKRDDEKYHDMLYALSWVPSGMFSMNASVQLTDDEELMDREGEFWAGVEAATRLSGGKHRAAIFFGRESGGMKCSNGVCRQVQPFSGLRLTLETSL